MHARHQRRDALSLLEVIISLSVFLLSLAALGFLLNVSGNLALDGEYRSRASALAQTKLAEVAAGAASMEGGSGSFDEDPDYQWTLDAQQAGTQGLYQVTVTVSRQRADGSTLECSLSQMVLDPTMVGSVYDLPPTGEENGETTDGTTTTDSSQDMNSTTTPTTGNSQTKSGGNSKGGNSKGGMGRGGNSNRGGGGNTNRGGGGGNTNRGGGNSNGGNTSRGGGNSTTPTGGGTPKGGGR